MTPLVVPIQCQLSVNIHLLSNQARGAGSQARRLCIYKYVCECTSYSTFPTPPTCIILRCLGLCFCFLYWCWSLGIGFKNCSCSDSVALHRQETQQVTSKPLTLCYFLIISNEEFHTSSLFFFSTKTASRYRNFLFYLVILLLYWFLKIAK